MFFKQLKCRSSLAFHLLISSIRCDQMLKTRTRDQCLTTIYDISTPQCMIISSVHSLQFIKCFFHSLAWSQVAFVISFQNWIQLFWISLLLVDRYSRAFTNNLSWKPMSLLTLFCCNYDHRFLNPMTLQTQINAWCLFDWLWWVGVASVGEEQLFLKKDSTTVAMILFREANRSSEVYVCSVGFCPSDGSVSASVKPRRGPSLFSCLLLLFLQLSIPQPHERGQKQEKKKYPLVKMNSI